MSPAHVCIHVCCHIYIYMYTQQVPVIQTSLLAAASARQAESGLLVSPVVLLVAAAAAAATAQWSRPKSQVASAGKQEKEKALIRLFLPSWTYAPSPSLHHAMPCFNLHIKIYRNS